MRSTSVGRVHAPREGAARAQAAVWFGAGDLSRGFDLGGARVDAAPSTSGRPAPGSRSKPADVAAPPVAAAIVAAAELDLEPDAAPPPPKPHMPISLFQRFESLPVDGHTLTADDENRTEDMRPKTAVYVWETRCVRCSGTGTVRSFGSRRGRGGHGTLATCLVCSGIGYVRHGSSRGAPPNLNNGGPHYTLGRPASPTPTDDARQSLWTKLRARLRH
eukprot:scaffold24.g2983.t1